ncbi:MAG: hypothetical protein HRT80_13765 [Henriciella sp.]|nr:hypothetical protein [Henriciella sp.]
MSYQIAKIAIASGIILTAFSPTAVADDHVETMTIYNDASGDGYISFDRVNGIGDKIVCNSDMQDETGDRIGTGSGHCTQLDAEKNFFCSFVISLDGRGMLAGQGVQQTEPTPSTYPIIGGAGEFEGVTGKMVSMPIEDRARFVYEISFK